VKRFTKGKYILQGTATVPCNDLMEWALAYEKTYRVALDDLGGVIVSTVFLGIDHNIVRGGDPKLFETMVCTDIAGWDEQHRYFIWEEAIEGHKRIVEKMRAKLAASKAQGTQALDAVMNKTEEHKGE
jgi:hypothetical protein